jgi:DNA-binding MarR family transcriptional regulator
MGIEHDIYQTTFRSEYQKSAINLIYTYNWFMERVKKILEKEDITSQQFNILRILRGQCGPLSTLQIRQRMLDKMSDTSRIVDRLIAKDLVKKVTCENDRRLVDVTITPKGLELLSELDKYQDDMDGLFSRLSEEEAKNLNTLLDKVRGGCNAE